MSGVDNLKELLRSSAIDIDTNTNNSNNTNNNSNNRTNDIPVLDELASLLGTVNFDLNKQNKIPNNIVSYFILFYFISFHKAPQFLLFRKVLI